MYPLLFVWISCCRGLTGFPVFLLLWQVSHLLLQVSHFLHQWQESTSDGEVTVTVYSSLLIQLYTWQNGEISARCIPYDGHCRSFGGLFGWVGEAEWYFTTVSHQVLMEVKQLLSNVFRTGTLLLVILKVQQHVDLQKHTQVWLWYKPCSTATKSNIYLAIVFEWDVGTSVLAWKDAV